MKFVTSVRKFVAIAALCAVATQAAPAAAAEPEPFRHLYVAGTAVCDAPAGEWVITWAFTNTFNVGATLGNIRVTPADRPVTNLPSEVPAGQTVTGEQRIPANTYSAGITVDVNWHDGPVDYNIYRPVYIKTTCNAA